MVELAAFEVEVEVVEVVRVMLMVLLMLSLLNCRKPQISRSAKKHEKKRDVNDYN